MEKKQGGEEDLVRRENGRGGREGCEVSISFTPSLLEIESLMDRVAASKRQEPLGVTSPLELDLGQTKEKTVHTQRNGEKKREKNT